jgi:hypothetical protein
MSVSAEEITFKYQPSKTGDIQTKKQEFQSTMKVTIKADGAVVNTLDQKQGKAEERKTTVLATDGENMSKVKIQYISSTMTPPGKVESVPLPNSGKTYLAEMKDGVVSITDAAGKAVEDAGESRLVTKDANSVMKPDKFSKFFNGKVLKPGDKVDIPDELARELIGSEDRPGKVEKMSLVLKEIKAGSSGKQGVFDFEMTMSTDVNVNMKMSMFVKGDTVVAADTCWPVSMNLSGPLTMKGGGLQDGKKMELDGTGDMTMKIEASYGK